MVTPALISMRTPRKKHSLDLHLFGKFRIQRGSRLIRLPTRKLESLLAFLALYPETHSRDKLITLFWGDVAESQARNSLRNALATLRGDGKRPHSSRPPERST
jgi:DNA-binding SARP family transcriptional activator